MSPNPSPRDALALRPHRALAALLGATLASGAAALDDAALRGAADRPGEWPMYGRTYDNQRYSPLADIRTENVAELRPVWAFSTGSLDGIEATPLVADGVMYVTGAWAQVHALDARTGRRLWHYAPSRPPGVQGALCCGPVNRGVALWGDLVFVTTLDARLVALDRRRGRPVWEQSFGDPRQGVTATGAPLVVEDRVIVGMSGGEYGVRGYLTAFHAANGGTLWKTYTIPAPGEPGADTWPGETWKTGGGATWQTGAYDPERRLVYWGTGNPAPWVSDVRRGDNLWTSSMLALDPADGRIRWGFQFTPNDGWDYDGNNTPVLADVTLDGRPRPVLMQNNRNGFLYVLERESGRFLYAEPVIDGINWARGIDPVTGRPEVDEAMRPVSGGPRTEPIVPSLAGGANWFPMAYDPGRGTLFLSANQWAMHMRGFPREDLEHTVGQGYLGMEFGMYRTGADIGRLRAFDPASRRWLWEWRSPQPLWSGLLATAGGLVFTGDQLGFLRAFDSATGKVLWKFQTGSGINAPPITYAVDGEQYVAVGSGMGGDPQYYFKGPRGGTIYAFALRNLPAEEDETGWSPEEIEGAVPLYQAPPLRQEPPAP